MNCAKCSNMKCFVEGQNCTQLDLQSVKDLYDEQDRNYMQAAGCTEADRYMQMTRLEESAYYAKQLGLKKLGIAFCLGLREEARLVVLYLEKEGFLVESVGCKACGVDKAEFSVAKIRPEGRETMCNPKAQAALLASAKTELNFTVGLCVGHDALFGLSSKAPFCCLIVKDRVLAHNPVGAVSSRYWQHKLGIKP